MNKPKAPKDMTAPELVAQIKAMKKPLTWNERINLMTVEEKAKLLVWEWIHKDECVFVALDGRKFTDRCIAVEHNKTLLTSPCEGWEKE